MYGYPFYTTTMSWWQQPSSVFPKNRPFLYLKTTKAENLTPPFGQVEILTVHYTCIIMAWSSKWVFTAHFHKLSDVKKIYIYIVVSHFNRGCMYICGHWQKVLVDVCRCSFPVKFEGFGVEGRSCHVVLPWQQNVWILTNYGPASLAEKKRKKIDMYDFPVYDCTQEQNSSPCFTSIV